LETIYVGGGTPSILSHRNLDLLLKTLSDHRVREWTVEANPESLSEGFIEACTDAGVTRISVGVQSNHDGHLIFLGRPGRRADNTRAIGLLASLWKGAVSVDLLTGIPGQTIAELEADLGEMVGSGIEHVSLYSLTVEPHTALAGGIAEGNVRMNGEEHDEDLWLSGRKLLEMRGLRNYEISNFARRGKECMHNMRYWRMEPYIGVGPSAVSTLPARIAIALGGKAAEAARAAPVVRISNPRDIGSYLLGERGGWGIDAEPVSGGDFLMETLLMGLRLKEGIRRERFTARFGRRFDELFPGLWMEWVDAGLATGDRDALRLTEKGRLMLNRLLVRLQERIQDPGFPLVDVTYP
jgi:oxygen-independent coproporphyrinogen-3 oxidase